MNFMYSDIMFKQFAESQPNENKTVEKLFWISS